jgi:ADP-ribose pyrophosphatase
MQNNSNPEILGEGRFLRLIHAGGWEWVDRVNASGATVIAACTADGQLVLIEQFRVPMGAKVIELPAGLVGDEPDSPDESMIESAQRELYEETGYESDDWHFATAGPASPGLTTEVFSLFVALNARKTGPGGGDSRENIVVHLAPLEEVHAWLDAQRGAGMMTDPKIYIGLYFLERIRK